MRMSKEDSVSEHLKSDERKTRKKEILDRASSVVAKNKPTKRPKRSNEEIQQMIESYREQLHDENMQPPPPAEFVDEFGKPIFENKSEIQLNVGMPVRFKGTRTGLPGMTAVPGSFKETKNGLQENVEKVRKFNAPPPQAPPMTMKEMNDNDREFSHTTDLTFRDLTTEAYREYMYNNGGVMRILQPWKLAISRSGNHRVATVDGFSYIIVPGWIAIRVKKKVGAPAFTF